MVLDTFFSFSLSSGLLLASFTQAGVSREEEGDTKRLEIEEGAEEEERKKMYHAMIAMNESTHSADERRTFFPLDSH